VNGVSAHPASSVAAAQPRAARWPAWAAPAAVAAAHLALKLPGAGRQALWLDEAVSVHLAELPLRALLPAVRHDTNPPLYYLLLWAWTRVFGDGEAAARAPSVLASALTGAVLYAVARRAGGRFVAAASAFLFLASAANLGFARQARPYALAALFGTLALGALLRLRERPSWAAAWALAAANAGGLLTHYVYALALGGQAVALLAPPRGWAAPRRAVIAHLPVAAAFGGWAALVAVGEGAQHMGWLAPAGWGQALWLLAIYANTSAAMGGVLIAAAVAAVAWARWRGRAPGAALAPAVACVAVPVALAAIASRWVPCFHERYLLYVTPAAALALALAFAALPPRAARAVATIAAAALLVRLAQLPTPPGFAWREAAAAASEARPDAVLLSPGSELRTFAYYLDRAAFRDATRTAERLRAGGVLPLDGGASAEAVPRDARTVLIVAAATAPPDAAQAAREALRGRGFAVAAERALPNVHVTVLARAPGAEPRGAER
jgi:hypothetical protein